MTGEDIRSRRQSKGLTQEQLAAKLKVSVTSLNRWENNKRKPSPLALGRLRAVLGK